MNTETIPAPTPIAICEAAYRHTAGKRPRWHIEPRFTGGSPAMISLGEVARVASQEFEARERCLTGVFGEELKAKAEAPDALKGIAYGRWEKGNKVFRFDLLTLETFEEPKRLTWDERTRLIELRDYAKRSAGFRLPMPGNMADELKALEYRARIHREEVKR